MENLKKFIQEEIQKLHQITLLENKKNQIERKLKLLSEGKEKLIGYDIPEWTMPALINRDYSGLKGKDKEKLNSFMKETKDINAMYRKAGMTPPDGKGIHTKKFHKCVTSVGDENKKNPYAICMSSLGKEKAVKASHRTDENIDETLNEEYINSLEMAAKDFIKNTLKLGTKENMFDAYMTKHKIERDNLRDFIDTVGYLLQDGRWW